MSPNTLSSLVIISLTTAIGAQECARYKDYPLNVCFNYSRATDTTYSKDIRCNETTNSYFETTYINTTTCESDRRITTALSCVEGVNCFCKSNNECDYVFYMTSAENLHGGVEEPAIQNISECEFEGIIYHNRPIIINQCLITNPNDTAGSQEIYQCDTSRNIPRLAVTPCSNGTATPPTESKLLCDLQCPAPPCGRFQYSPINTCSLIINGSRIQSQKTMCTGFGQYTQTIYNDDKCAGTTDDEKQLTCAEGTECICNNDNPCEYATTRVYVHLENATNVTDKCVGDKYKEKLYVLNECLSSTIGHEFAVDSQLTCTNGTIMRATCSEDAGSNAAIEEMDVCHVECAGICDRTKHFPVGVCLKAESPASRSSWDYTCDGGLSFTKNIYNDTQCQGKVLHYNEIPCEGECYCSSGIPCPHALFTVYIPDVNATNDTQCSGSSRMQFALVTDECVDYADLAKELGIDFTNKTNEVSIVNSSKVAISCNAANDELLIRSCDSSQSTDLKGLCHLECIGATEENVTSTTTTPEVTTTTSEPVCDRAREFPIGVCTGVGVTASADYTCDAGGNFIYTTYNGTDCRGLVLLTKSTPCDGDCHCSSGVVCPHALFKVYSGRDKLTRCGTMPSRHGQPAPLNICLKETDNGIVTSKIVSCDTETEIFTQKIYDDDQCEGSIINEAIITCEDPNLCICSDIKCDYASWTEGKNITGNATACAGDTIDHAIVLNQCFDMNSIKWTCDNATDNAIIGINCTDNMPVPGRTITFSDTDGCNFQCGTANNTLPPTTTQDECSGSSFVEFAVVINECIQSPAEFGNGSSEISCDAANDQLLVQPCDGGYEPIVMPFCEVECIGVDNTTQPPEEPSTTAEEPSTTEMETTEMETTEMETTYECLDREGSGSSGDFNIGFYIDCVEEEITINITYSKYNGNWFGVLFQQPNENTNMYGEALIYTIGKADETIPNQDGNTPKLYLYNLTAQEEAGVNYNGGDNGERNWKEISKNVEEDRAELIYKQSLDETAFDLSTENIPMRWAFGASKDYVLVSHQPDGKATSTLNIGLEEVTTTTTSTVGPSKDDDDNKAGIIIGSVIGAFFAVMICFGIIWAIMDHKKDISQPGSAYGAVGGADTDAEEDVEMQGTR